MPTEMIETADWTLAGAVELYVRMVMLEAALAGAISIAETGHDGLAKSRVPEWRALLAAEPKAPAHAA